MRLAPAPLALLWACAPAQAPRDVDAPRQAILLAPPSLSAAKLTASDGASSDAFGQALAGAGDVDGDGYDDVVIGASADDDGARESGSAYAWFGDSGGLDANSERKLGATDPAYADAFGAAIAGAGDLNGDGYDDVAIGAPYDDDVDYNSGSVYLFFGAAGNRALAVQRKITPSDGAAQDAFGCALDGAGDVDGDGLDDLIVGAWKADDRTTDAGAAYVFYGSSAGVDPSREDKLLPSRGGYTAYFGVAVSGAGDVDGDGYGEVLIGAPQTDASGRDSGEAYVFFGSSAGVDLGSEQGLVPSDAAAYDVLGYAVDGGEDLDGDGFDDLAVGARQEDEAATDAGAVYVFYGSAAGVDTSREDKLFASDAASVDAFGWSVALLGDLDGDGFGDLLVGAPQDDDAGGSSGAAWVFYGSATGPDPATALKLVASDGAPNDLLGTSVAAAGDVNGDGLADLLLGVPGDDDSGSASGAAWLHLGACQDLDGDGVCVSEDCDDTDASVFPGSAEQPADGVDSDCDGEELCYADADSDGYTRGSVSSPYVNCDGPGDAAAPSDNEDCDDGDDGVHPGGEEWPGDGVDGDCDGGELCFVDNDGDGWIVGYATTASDDLDCDDAGEAWEDAPGGDCDDGAPAVHPDAEELCNHVDDDCDGEVDVGATDARSWYGDQDGDGFGDPDQVVVACEAPPDTSHDPRDCDDEDPDAYPGAVEIPDDGIDQSCDGEDLVEDPPKDCGCATSAPRGGAWAILLALAWLGRRRR